MLISRRTKWGLRAVALLYLLLLLILPVAIVFIKTFEHGFGTAWAYMTTPAAISALWLSILMAVVAVPLNAVFGVGAALMLVRGRHRRFAAVLNAFIDLPFLVSPVIVGLALTLVYGIHGWFGSWFAARGIQIIFAPTGMILATVFVSLPFVVREVAPVLAEVGDEQEQAAATLGASGWQTFRRITLPTIRWRWPPDSWCGRCPPHCVSPTRSSSSSTFALTSDFGRLRILRPKATFSRTLMCANAA